MCSRFQLKAPGDEVASFFAIEDFPDWTPQTEIRPTDLATVIVDPNQAVLMPFGLPAPWDAKKPILNARAETLEEKATFSPFWNSAVSFRPAATSNGGKRKQASART